MTGIRRSIYIPEDEVAGIEDAAERIDRSVSWYLIDCHRQISEFRREEHLDEIPSGVTEITVTDRTATSVTLPDDSESESSVILEDTEKPTIRSTKPEIKKPLPKNPGKRAIIAKIKETGHFNPQPKKKDKK